MPAMRSIKAVPFALALSFVGTLAFAQQAATLSPSQIFVGDAETFLTVTGTGVLGTDSTVVTFDDGAGHVFSVGPSTPYDPSSHPSTDTFDVFVPIDVAGGAARWSVTLQVTDVGQPPRFIGPIVFDVVDRPTGGGPPQLSLPEVQVGEASSAAGGNVTFLDGGASCDHVSGSFFPMGTTTVTCSASNSFGTSTATFLVVVTDSTPPVVNVPADIVSTSPTVTFTVTATDNIDGTITSGGPSAPFVSCNPPSGSTFPEGDTTVQCIAADAHLNFATGQFKVTIIVKPVLSLPADFSVEATGPSGATVNYTATAVGGPISCAPASGSVFPLGTTAVQCSATNSAGTTTGSFNVSVVDTTPPTVTVPADIIREATGPSGAAVTFTATATDIVDGTVAVTCVPASGSTFPIATTLVQCTATDAHSNTGRGSFSVTVRDTTPPAITVPADITAEATGPSGAAVTFTVTAVDIVDGDRPVTCSPASGSTFALGTTTVQCTASDTRSNSSTASFHVTVRDTTPPTVTSITASPDTLWPPNHKMHTITVSVIATDLVDPHPVSTIVDVTSNQPINGPGDGNTTPDWQITGALTVDLRAERAQGEDRIYTIHVDTADFSGNVTHSTVTVRVGH